MTNKIFSKSLVVSVLALASLTATSSNAAVIYNNGAPTTDNGYSIANNNSTADDFTIVSGGTIRSVGFYFQNYNGITGWDQQISYSFLADVGGTPGGVIASGSGQNVTPTLSSFPWCCGGGNAWLVEFDLATDFVANAGSAYWLALSGAGGPTPWWVTASSQGSGNGVLPSANNFNTGYEFAFYLSDTNIGQVSNVPEPTSFALGAIGLFGLAAARLRKQRNISA